MKLDDLFESIVYDVDGFIELTLVEGVGSEQAETVRSIVASAKELAIKLDGKMETKFRKEFNKQVQAFTKVSAKDDIRAIDAKLASVRSVYNKYSGMA